MNQLTENLTIRVKVILLTVIGILTAAVIAASGTYELHKVGKELTVIAHETIPLTDAIMNITVHQLEQAISFERAARFAEIMESDDHAKELYENS